MMASSLTLAETLEPVNLGSAAPFAILSGAAISSTGGGLIDGDVGACPIGGAAIGLTTAQVNGTIYAIDAGGPAGSVVDPGRLIAAKAALTAAYTDAAARTPNPTGDYLNPGSGNLGGMNLGPGLFRFTSTALLTGADLTLTGESNDVWIFQIGSTLQAGAGRRVILAGNAQARNVFWQVGTSATLGTSSSFKGTIMADQAITMDATSELEGRALASITAVTFNGRLVRLPLPEAPWFTAIFPPAEGSMTVVLETTPFFLLTLEKSKSLSPTNWMILATNIPYSTPWTYTDIVCGTTGFYRAFITPY